MKFVKLIDGIDGLGIDKRSNMNYLAYLLRNRVTLFIPNQVYD